MKTITSKRFWVLFILVLGILQFSSCTKKHDRTIFPKVDELAFKVYGALNAIDQNYFASTSHTNIKLLLQDYQFHYSETDKRDYGTYKFNYFGRILSITGSSISPITLTDTVGDYDKFGNDPTIDLIATDTMTQLVHPENPYDHGFSKKKLPPPMKGTIRSPYTYSDGAISQPDTDAHAGFSYSKTIGFGVNKHISAQPIAPISLAYFPDRTGFLGMIPAWRVVNGPAGQFTSRLNDSSGMSEAEQLEARFEIEGTPDPTTDTISGSISIYGVVYGTYTIRDYSKPASFLDFKIN